MSQELVRVMCPECGASRESDSQPSRWQCTSCGNGFFLRRCSACARVSYVDGLQGFRRPWPCTWCGEFNAGFSQNRDPAEASAAELAAEVARYDLPGSPGDPGASGQADSAPVTDSDPGPGTRGPGDRGLRSTMDTGLPGVPLPDPVAATTQSGRRRARRIALSIAAVVACATAISVLLTAGGTGTTGMTAGLAGHGSAERAVHVTASQVGTIDFQGVPGQLTVVGTGSGQVILTGQLHGTGGAPTVETRVNHAGGVLGLSVRCAPAGPCTQNLRLTVPGDTGTAVRQPGGRVVVTGLAGPLRITAASVDITASGLRSPSLTTAITNGHLSAAFTVPPRQVSITLASAQATLRLPARTAYRVAQHVTSGYIGVAVPQAGTATRTVTATIHSGELSLLPC